jgi:hypothetical protein
MSFDLSKHCWAMGEQKVYNAQNTYASISVDGTYISALLHSFASLDPSFPEISI